ncbi:hypothetical protein ACQKFO_18710 [Rossellomorea sp. NPDC071047]|uniref:hypothetical protein n=1 Tax=Rossellomorea sp. NPDC071047 TaxID=3390675 RepID=UPI003D0830AE
MRILTVSFLLIVVMIVGCGKSDVLHNIDFEKTMYSIVKDQHTKEINIKPLTDFKWDKAYLFEPYTPQEHIEKRMGAEFEDPSNIRSRDDIYLIVFLNDGNVVQYAEISRQKTDFSIGEKEHLSPSEDVLKIER